MMFNGPPGFGMMSSNLPSFIFLAFFLILGVVIYYVIQNMRQWNYNNNQPVLTIDAKVVTKRTQVTRHHNHHNHDHGSAMHVHSHTIYYVTFEVESGDRMELNVGGKEFGIIAEGDTGKLTFQGTRYISFER